MLYGKNRSAVCQRSFYNLCKFKLLEADGRGCIRPVRSSEDFLLQNFIVIRGHKKSPRKYQGLSLRVVCSLFYGG